MHAEDLYGGICLFDGAGDSADEASAADGGDDDLDARMLLQDFEAESSLPCDDGVVVESMNQREAFLLTLLDCLFVGFVIVCTVQEDLGAIGASRRNFRERRRQRHDDARRNLMASSMVGDALCMVTRGGGYHSPVSLFLGEGQEFVQGAALFKRSGTLLVIEFEKDGVIGETGKCFRMRARRNANVGTNSFESRLDIGKLDHDAGAAILLHLRTRVGVGMSFRNSCTTKDTKVHKGVPLNVGG